MTMHPITRAAFLVIAVLVFSGGDRSLPVAALLAGISLLVAAFSPSCRHLSLILALYAGVAVASTHLIFLWLVAGRGLQEVAQQGTLSWLRIVGGSLLSLIAVVHDRRSDLLATLSFFRLRVFFAPIVFLLAFRHTIADQWQALQEAYYMKGIRLRDLPRLARAREVSDMFSSLIILSLARIPTVAACAHARGLAGMPRVSVRPSFSRGDLAAWGWIWLLGVLLSQLERILDVGRALL